MKAIVTRYVGPTDRRGSRIIASDGDGNKVTVSYDSSKSYEEPHFVAVKALCKKMGWTGEMVCGATRTGYVWVWKSTETWFVPNQEV